MLVDKDGGLIAGHGRLLCARLVEARTAQYEAQVHLGFVSPDLPCRYAGAIDAMI